MIYHKDKEVALLYYGSIAISAVYHGAQLVWQAIRSCFGKGWWVSDKPWLSGDNWKNE